MLEIDKTDSQKTGQLIYFEGLDGAGKTTIARKLGEYLLKKQEKAIFVDKKSTDFSNEYFEKRMHSLRNLIWEYPLDAPIQDLGDEHWLYIMASWFSTFDRCKIRPLVKDGYTVITDSSPYKFMARFMLKPHIDKVHMNECFSSLLSPNLIIFLDISPKIAASRKQKFTTGETGSMDGLTGNPKENFIIYQTSVRQALLNLCQHKPNFLVSVDELDEEEIVNIIASHLQKSL